MQMRSCAVWLSVLALFASASPVFAAPKGKKHKKEAAVESSEKAEPAAEPDKGKSKGVDDLMEDSTKRKPAAAVKSSEPEPEEKVSEDVGEPDAWERPPAEEEKPKRKKVTAAPEEKKGDGRNLNIGLLAGYGFSLGAGFTGLNPYGLGVGLQGDYELESHLVVGAGGEFFLGESDPNGNLGRGAYGRYVLGHFQVGYNVWLSQKLILRPSIWVGMGFGLQQVAMNALSGVVASVLLAPGLSLHHLMGENGWYVGADVRFTVQLMNNGMNGLPILLTLGKRF